jgi:hypothetical protein
MPPTACGLAEQPLHHFASPTPCLFHLCFALLFTPPLPTTPLITVGSSPSSMGAISSSLTVLLSPSEPSGRRAPMSFHADAALLHGGPHYRRPAPTLLRPDLHRGKLLLTPEYLGDHSKPCLLQPSGSSSLIPPTELHLRGNPISGEPPLPKSPQPSSLA